MFPSSLLSQRSGYFYAILAAALFGASTPAAKRLLDESSPWLLAGILYLGSGIGLLLIYLFLRLRRPLSAKIQASLKGKDWLWFCGATLFGGILAPVLLMLGLEASDAGSAALLLNLEGPATALLAWFVFREHFNQRVLLGMLAILAGGIVLSWTGEASLSSVQGPLLIGAACLSWGIDNNLTKQISASDALQISFLKGLIAGGANTFLAFQLETANGSMDLSVGVVLLAGVVGLLGYGVSLLCFVLALRDIGAARTGACFALAPFIGAGIAVISGDQESDLRFVSAGILMGFGVWLHLTERREPLQT